MLLPWTNCGPAPAGPLLETPRFPDNDVDLLCAVLRQTSFLKGSLTKAGAVSWQQAAAWLARAVRKRRERRNLLVRQEMSSIVDEGSGNSWVDCWGLPAVGCDLRPNGSDARRHLRATAEPKLRRGADQPGARNRWRPVARSCARSGDLPSIITLPVV